MEKLIKEMADLLDKHNAELEVSSDRVKGKNDVLMVSLSEKDGATWFDLNPDGQRYICGDVLREEAKKAEGSF